MAQTFGDWECICVDDGSTDESGRILDEYAAKDGRFRVIHQPNGGVASARQKGLDSARGEWIAWFDADDWAEPGNLEHLYSGSEGVDFVWANYRQEDERGKGGLLDTACAETAEELNVAILSGRTWGALWNKLFSRSCVVRLGIGFPDRTHDGEEDVCFTCAFLTHGVKVRHVDSADYHYVVRKGSLAHSEMSDALARRLVNVCDFLAPVVKTPAERAALGVRRARVKSWLALSPSVSDACYYSVYPELSLTAAFPTAPLHRKLRFWLADHHLRSVYSWLPRP